MALAAAGVPFRFEAVEGAEFKCDLEHYRFGQARAADGVGELARRWWRCLAGCCPTRQMLLSCCRLPCMPLRP